MAAPSDQHDVGLVDDSVYFHAVARGTAMTVCGRELRLAGDDAPDEVFEELWLDDPDCCTACGDALGLDPDAVRPEPEAVGRTGRNWAPYIIGGIGGIGLLMGMVQMIARAL